MKVTIAYQCDFEDIPTTVYELLGNIKENDLPHLEINLSDAISYSNQGNITETLAAMDEARLRLSKIDQKLLEGSKNTTNAQQVWQVVVKSKPIITK